MKNLIWNEEIPESWTTKSEHFLKPIIEIERKRRRITTGRRPNIFRNPSSKSNENDDAHHPHEPIANASPPGDNPTFSETHHWNRTKTTTHHHRETTLRNPSSKSNENDDAPPSTRTNCKRITTVRRPRDAGSDLGPDTCSTLPRVRTRVGFSGNWWKLGFWSGFEVYSELISGLWNWVPEISMEMENSGNWSFCNIYLIISYNTI